MGIAGQSGVGIASVGGNRHVGKSLHGDLYFLTCLRQPTCLAPRNERCSVDDSRDYSLACLGLHRFRDLLSDARAPALSLSTVREQRWGALQLLPQLQMQLASLVPALQARSRRNRQVLPLLRK